MSRHIDAVLATIDGALADEHQHSPEAGLFADVAPDMSEDCWRCGSEEELRDSGLCRACVMFLAEVCDDDPLAPPTPSLPELLDGLAAVGPARPPRNPDGTVTFNIEVDTTRLQSSFDRLRVAASRVGAMWRDMETTDRAITTALATSPHTESETANAQTCLGTETTNWTAYATLLAAGMTPAQALTQFDEFFVVAGHAAPYAAQVAATWWGYTGTLAAADFIDMVMSAADSTGGDPEQIARGLCHMRLALA